MVQAVAPAPAPAEAAPPLRPDPPRGDVAGRLLVVDGGIVFDWQDDSGNYQFWASAMIAELRHRHVPVEVRRGFVVRTLGEERRATEGEGDLEMTVRSGERAYDAPAGTRRVAIVEDLDPAERRELAAREDEVERAIDKGELRLTPEGARALAVLGDRSGDAEGFRPGDGRQLVDGRHIRPLLDQGFFAFRGGQEALVRRYVLLQDRSDTRTAGVFVRPLPA